MGGSGLDLLDTRQRAAGLCNLLSTGQVIQRTGAFLFADLLLQLVTGVCTFVHMSAGSSVRVISQKSHFLSQLPRAGA